MLKTGMFFLLSTFIIAQAENSEKLKTDLEDLNEDGKTVIIITKKEPRPINEGGAGGFAPSIIELDISPVQDVVKNEVDLRNKNFDLSDNQFFMIGGMGYGGKRNGGRIGGGGWFGYKRYYSDKFTTLLTDSTSIALKDTLRDSLTQLHTMLAYGGMIAEGGFNWKEMNVHFGGLFGGGALILGKENLPYNNNSAFTGNTMMRQNKDTTDNMSSQWAVAPLLVFDAHAGATVSVLKWMQVGADAQMLVLYSAQGFGYGYKSFLTYNPGVRLRFLFGNLG